MKKSLMALALMFAVPSAFACVGSDVTREQVRAEMFEFFKQYPNHASDLDYPANVMPKPVSTKTREEVRTEMFEFFKLYPNHASDIDYPANVMPKPVSTKTREQVKGELADFLANGGYIPVGDSDYPMPKPCGK